MPKTFSPKRFQYPNLIKVIGPIWVPIALLWGESLGGKTLGQVKPKICSPKRVQDPNLIKLIGAIWVPIALLWGVPLGEEKLAKSGQKKNHARDFIILTL